jgi:hypothetical protein
MELVEITNYQAVVGSLMYAVLATWPDISYSVAAHFHYNSRPFTSHMTAANRALQYLKSTALFQLPFNSNGNGIGIDIGNSIIVYSDSNWTNNSADHKSEGDHGVLTSSVSNGFG